LTTKFLTAVRNSTTNKSVHTNINKHHTPTTTCTA
jgi:hypothetical protein